jgi:hypothetical protein
VKRPEVLFIALLICIVPPTLYLMSKNTRYESHEITCLNESGAFKLSYESLSLNKSVMFEDINTQNQVQVNEVTPDSFSFMNKSKAYKINLEADTALIIEEGVNEIFRCAHEVFKM